MQFQCFVNIEFIVYCNTKTCTWLKKLNKETLNHQIVVLSHMHTYQQTAPCVWWSSPPLLLLCSSMTPCWCASAQTAAVAIQASPGSSTLHRSIETHTHIQAGNTQYHGGSDLQTSWNISQAHRQTDNTCTSAKYIRPSHCVLNPTLQTCSIKLLLPSEGGGRKCGSVPAPHNFQFKDNLRFN